jgi:glycosyltransferase involved in cell wall biosynthesis
VSESKKRILHLTPLAACGGCEVNCLRIIQALDDCDHHVVVFGGRGPMTEAWEAEGTRVEHMEAWGLGLGQFASALGDWSKAQTRPDAVMYWSSSRLPTVLRVLGHWKSSWVVYLGNPLAKGLIPRIRRCLDERLHPAIPGVTLAACSNHVAESHRSARYFRRFATEVIYNAVDPAFDRTHCHRLLPSGSAPRIGMVARLDRIKDHRTVIRALAAITPVRPDIVVEFAGDGPLREELEREARRLNVGDRVEFLGFKQVSPLLAKWDIYVHSTTNSEGMGTAVAEAMMSGLPCLVSDIEVMREVCGQDGAAYAPAGDANGFSEALLQLIQDKARRETLGGAAQSRARRMFGSSQIASAYARLAFPGAAIGAQ